MQFSCDPDQEGDELPQYEHIYQNDFSYRKHKKQKEEDISICECKFDFGDPDSACGERCLNVITNTECTPGYCPCGVYCKNQKFQKCEYAKTKLIKCEGRGWGLVALEEIKAGQFIMEYCGEVISWKEAKKRAQTYETHGVKDAYIISLNASEAIDATKKGSLARFINHSCRPNCETRKWNVLGEVRVGIFAKESISPRTELAYDYNFEWYGGAKVRCLCGAVACSGFLGAKSRGFQEDTYVWEDGDDRYSVDKIPVYDSAEDELTSEPSKNGESNTNEEKEKDISTENHLESTALNIQQQSDSTPTPMEEDVVTETVKTETSEDMKLLSQNSQEDSSPKTAIVSRVHGNISKIKSESLPKKRGRPFSGGKTKNVAQKHVDIANVVQLLATKEAQDEVLKYEVKQFFKRIGTNSKPSQYQMCLVNCCLQEVKKEAAVRLSSLYDEIRPAIEEHERDSQDSVATSVAEKWIQASCNKLKAEFDLYSSVIKNIASTPIKPQDTKTKVAEAGNEDHIKLLEAK
ncbi:SET domain [Arabidopsis thaliana x Arabidopsis arenosa]|uniref:SET domain group 26 n=3 Tax=Arabidopsis TaxID=3701 RepID=A0A1P8AR04_ARATH|nr:SET domain group 26 [Arabidopsis thaliana]ANM59092.1 SET domain group 26 [Arabidopsis thaliana]KAG7651936.1 SET domain [Arabidopsis thaliana x Arabidopsis arenosa]KAG7659806.1 SET domain [Arabidopsis suecica]|eukprot:NP_001321484.1 SET domain group 26 [Arabidopsis thaliana]